MPSCEEKVPGDLPADLRAECCFRHDIHAGTEFFLEVLRQPDKVKEIRTGTELDKYVDIAALPLFLTVRRRIALIYCSP